MLNQLRRYYTEGFSKKLLVAAGVVTALGVMCRPASADNFAPFSIDPNVLNSDLGTSVTGLGEMSGSYGEGLTLTPTSATSGTFTTSAWMNFTTMNLAVDPNNTVNAGTTGLNAGSFGYGIYALFASSGTYTVSGGLATFTATPGTCSSTPLGCATLYDDASDNTTFNTSGGVATNSGDDLVLGSAALLSGGGSQQACIGTDCGSFGLIFQPVILNSLGSSYFTSPTPFYITAFMNGVFNPFTVGGGLNAQTFNVTGNGGLTFTPVPEPATLTMLGLGLVGIARARRRRNASV